MLDELVGVLAGKGITLTLEESAVSYLVDQSYSVAYGARNLRRLIQKELEDPIATKLIENYMTPISQIKVTAQDGKLDILGL